MQGLADKRLSVDLHLQQHIDTCLLCRNCERVCPAGVKVGHIIDTGRALIRKDKPLARVTSFLLRIPAHSSRMRFLNNILWLYQSSGLMYLLRKLNLLRFSRFYKAEQLLPAIHPASNQRKNHPSRRPTKGCIALFIGCLGETFEQQTTQALIKLLTELQYDVDVISQQTCCGALAIHAGDEQQSLKLAKQNIQAFLRKDYDVVLYSATGCGIQLKDYANLSWTNDEEKKQAEQFVLILEEITHFLNRIPWPDTVSFSPLQKLVAVHEPCSQRNVLRQSNLSSVLLNKIPDLKIIPLPNNEQCCGAAGAYMLTHEKQAYALRQSKIEAVAQNKIDIVVTTNPGCSLFLGAGLATKKIQVVHPAFLLATQLRSP